MIRTNFYQEGNFYKGNMHCHSVLSDGKLTPQQLKESYRSKGYHFILFSDHNINTHFAEFNQEDFIALQGFEGNLQVDQAADGYRKEFHFNMLKTPDKYLKDKKFMPYGHLERVPTYSYTGLDSVQQYIDIQYNKGYMVMLNHTHWSHNAAEEAFHLKHIFAMEIFNFGCHIAEDTGDCSEVYDLLLRKGKKLWITATDDNHNGIPMNQYGSDSFGGFIVVKAKSLGEEDILEAIYDGSFYSSMGPCIYDFKIEDDEIKIRCSDAKRIYITDNKGRYRAAFDENCHLTEFSAKLVGDEQYVKAVVYDNQDQRAFTNPIFI